MAEPVAFDPTTAKLLDSPAFDPQSARLAEEPTASADKPWYEKAAGVAKNFVAHQLGETMNLAAGGIRGAGSIGATIAALYDVPSDLLAGRGALDSNRQRRAAMDEALQGLLGADPQSLPYQVGKIGAEIAGTAGTGNLLARGAMAAGAPTSLLQALQSGGAAGGNIAGRVAGGAITGGVAAGMINPEEAATGAVIGGALPVAQVVAKGAVAAGRNMIGNMTGTGAESLRVAYQSGKAGGSTADTFSKNMRGTNNMQDVLDDARRNLDAMRASRASQYRQSMDQIRTDKTVLDMAPIEQSVQDTIRKFTFKGQARNPKVLEALQSVSDEINAWKQLDPAQFHTAEGLDALKQRIGSALESVPYEARAVRTALNDVYKSVWGQIQKQAPTYARTMKSYEEASKLIDEINRSLSLGENKTADTAMRKLQSVMRNNVNTNYGVRVNSVRELEQQGGRDLMPALAGQTLNEWMPRGLQRATSPIAAVGAGAMGGIPAFVGTSLASSPRLMGEAAFLAGKASPFVDDVTRLLYRAAPVVGAQ